MIQEPFVSVDEAAAFLSINRRYLLALARKGISGAYPVNPNSRRKVWVFRLSELAAEIISQKHHDGVIPTAEKYDMIRSGSPR